MIEEKRRRTSWRSIRLQPDLHKEAPAVEEEEGDGKRMDSASARAGKPWGGERTGKKENKRRRKQRSKKEGIAMDNAERV